MSNAANLRGVAEAILDAEQGCVDPTDEYVSWRSLGHLARMVLDATGDNAPVDERSALIARCEELEDALVRVSAGPRPDGTYNLSREACEQIAKEALRRGDT